MKKILFVFTLSLILAAAGYVFSAGYYGTTNSSTTGLTLGTNATLTVADSVAANITAPFGSGAFADTYDGTGVNITATTANITTLTAVTSFKSPVVTKSGTGALSAAECTGTIINIYGQTDDMTLTLPTAFEGGSFRIQVSAALAKYIRIDPNGSEVQSFDGTDLTGGYYVYLSAATKGAMIQYVAIKTGASTWQWAALTMVGQWYVQTS
jgi:hypothetical protein